MEQSPETNKSSESTVKQTMKSDNAVTSVSRNKKKSVRPLNVQVIKTGSILQKHNKKSGKPVPNTIFCYHGINYDIHVKSKSNLLALRKSITKCLNQNGVQVFPSDLDVQAEDFFSKNAKGVSIFTMTEGYVIPVLKAERLIKLKSEDVVEVKNHRIFEKELFDGCYRNHINLTIICNSLSWQVIKIILNNMKCVPFPCLEHLTIECKRSISKNYLSEFVSSGFFSKLIDITLRYKVQGEPFDTMVKRKEYEGKMKNKAEQAKANKKASISTMNPDAKPFIPTSIPNSQGSWGNKSFGKESEKEDESAQRRRKHRNINRNNGVRGVLPDILQLIEDLKLDQSELRSIRIHQPIMPEIMQLFMEAFIQSNCSNIEALCLCQTDLTGIDCDVLKRFMECDNMHNIEVLSFGCSKLSDEQLHVVLSSIYDHHLDNIRDLDFDDVVFSLDNLELLHKIVRDQILLKLWSIHLRNPMIDYDEKKMNLINSIVEMLNNSKMLYIVC